MWDARDAEDERLLQEGRFADLVAGYYADIVDRCRTRIRRADAEDVAHAIVERLLRELKGGKRYPVPYRIVVAMVTTWLIKGYYEKGKIAVVELGDWDDPVPDDFTGDVETRDLVERLLEHLPDHDRTVAGLRWLDGLEIAEIAKKLGMKRNAVDQSLFRARQTFRTLLA